VARADDFTTQKPENGWVGSSSSARRKHKNQFYIFCVSPIQTSVPTLSEASFFSTKSLASSHPSTAVTPSPSHITHRATRTSVTKQRKKMTKKAKKNNHFSSPFLTAFCADL
jgi:hypothetical protein